VVYVGAGRGEMVREGVPHPCNKEDILLIHPGEKHQVCSHAEESLQQYYFGFTFDFTPVDSLSWSAPRTLPHGPLLDLIRSDLRQCHNLVRNQKDKEALEISRSLLMPVVSRIVGYLVAPARKADAHLHARRNSPVQLAKEFIQPNLQSHDTVRELAERFGLSPQYFGKLFKKETGLTVKEYQTKVRAHRALELLHDSTLKITDIAHEVWAWRTWPTFPGSSRSSTSSRPVSCGNRGSCRTRRRNALSRAHQAGTFPRPIINGVR
jgi:hypothetical protein